jgi:hypothetical protein
MLRWSEYSRATREVDRDVGMGVPSALTILLGHLQYRVLVMAA